MIRDYEIYHGFILNRLVHKYSEFKISSNINGDNSSYIINDKYGIYIKFCKKRLTPWLFTFTSEHYKAILSLTRVTERVYIVLACGMDGICCIGFEEFSLVITDILGCETKSVSAIRFKNQQYQISGTDGEIKHKFADSELLIF